MRSRIARLKWVALAVLLASELFANASTLPPGNWHLLTDDAASQLTGDLKEYLYVDGDRWYMSPVTTLVWNWSTGQELTGEYSDFDGTSVNTFFCGGSDEVPQWGIGCSSGPGSTTKVLPYYSNDPAAGQGTVCQDVPDAFGVSACGWATIYVNSAPSEVPEPAAMPLLLCGAGSLLAAIRKTNRRRTLRRGRCKAF